MRRSTTSCCSALLGLLGCGLLGCGPVDEAPVDEGPACDSPGETHVFVVSVLLWGRAADGVSDGFDLDGIVSNSNDPRGCKIEDYVSPEGVTGIDNGFARVLPALELTEAVAVEGLIAQSIADGNLLITLELSGVDDLQNDDCVDLTIARATGDVLLGTDGLLLDGQTLVRDPTLPSTTFSDLSIVDGRLVATPLDWSLPLTVFNVSLDFELMDGAVRLDLGPDGGAAGVFGGGVSVDYIVNVAAAENVDAELVGLMSTLLDSYADLEPDADGVCQTVSVNFEVEAIDAFLYED